MSWHRRLSEAIAWRIVDAADLHEYRAYRRGQLGAVDPSGVRRPAKWDSPLQRLASAIVRRAQRRAVR